MLRIGLLGCGNIGHIIAQHAGSFEIRAVYDLVFERAQKIATLSGSRAFDNFETFIASDMDIVVEQLRSARLKFMLQQCSQITKIWLL